MSCNLKSITFTVFKVGYSPAFQFSGNIVKQQVCGLLHKQELDTFRLSLLSKLVVSRKLLHLECFVYICSSPAIKTCF